MQSLTSQCNDLDSEYEDLKKAIANLMDKLTQVSLEFVQSKLLFLEKYSETLKATQLDARQHRNVQVKNLIEYVKLHTRSKVKSALGTPKKKHIANKYSWNEPSYNKQYLFNSEEGKTINISSILKTNSNVQTKNHTVHQSGQKSIQKLSNSVIQELIQKQNKANRVNNESVFDVLQQAMTLLESKKELYLDKFTKINNQYKLIKEQNKHLVARKSLLAASSSVKENITSLQQSQQSFQLYLDSII